MKGPRRARTYSRRDVDDIGRRSDGSDRSSPGAATRRRDGPWEGGARGARGASTPRGASGGAARGGLRAGRIHLSSKARVGDDRAARGAVNDDEPVEWLWLGEFFGGVRLCVVVCTWQVNISEREDCL